MTLRQFLTACHGVSDAVLDTEMKILFDAGGVFYNSSVDSLAIASETNFIGPSGVLNESALAEEIESLTGEGDESLKDYEIYLPKNTLILYAKSQFIQK